MKSFDINHEICKLIKVREIFYSQIKSKVENEYFGQLENYIKEVYIIKQHVDKVKFNQPNKIEILQKEFKFYDFVLEKMDEFQTKNQNELREAFITKYDEIFQQKEYQIEINKPDSH